MNIGSGAVKLQKELHPAFMYWTQGNYNLGALWDGEGENHWIAKDPWGNVKTCKNVPDIPYSKHYRLIPRGVLRSWILKLA